MAVANGKKAGRTKSRKGTMVPRERLDAVAEMLARCVPHVELERAISARFHICRRQVRTYIRRVYDEWAAHADERRPFVRNEMDAAFRRFYQRAMDAEDYKSAVTALDRLAKLHGAYEPDRVEVSGADGGAIDVSVGDPEAVRARIQELLGKHRDLKTGGKGVKPTTRTAA